MDSFIRSEMVLGKENMEKLKAAKVAVFGIGGVGGYVAEALARSGIGAFVLVDHDTVSESNLNRQIIATHQTIGKAKVNVMRERILDINPDADVEIRKCFYLPENAQEFDFSEYSYVVDAVDTVTAKLEIIMRAKESKIPVISSMGTGNKLDSTKLQVADIYQTTMCPLAKVMRHECRKRGITDLKVVFSTEEPLNLRHGYEDSEKKEEENETENEAEKEIEKTAEKEAGKKTETTAKKQADKEIEKTTENVRKKDIPGSLIFVPAAAGLILAGEVIKDLIK